MHDELVALAAHPGVPSRGGSSSTWREPPPPASAARGLVRATLRREPAAPLARWTSRLAIYVEARLRRVLALTPDEPIDETLIRRRARVFVSPTHVDVVLRLAELPIDVRIAGLDRTPGWIPATGRHVALHFE